MPSRPDCVLLCNESFAATNEREGSEIARQVVRALRGARHPGASSSPTCTTSRTASTIDPPEPALFLRAERASATGERTFKLVEGEPLPTSYGEDSYQRVFGAELGGPAAAVSDPGR